MMAADKKSEKERESTAGQRIQGAEGADTTPTRVDAADVLALDMVRRGHSAESHERKAGHHLTALREAAGGGPFFVDDDNELWAGSKPQWFSVCSAHRSGDDDCPACEVGQWHLTVRPVEAL